MLLSFHSPLPLYLDRCHHLEVREQDRQYEPGVSDCSVGRDLSLTSVGRTLDIRLSFLESLSGEILFRAVSRGETIPSIWRGLVNLLMCLS